MFEGNEINFLRKRKLDLQELVLLSTPEENCDNFERAELLLSKQNKVQVMAVFNVEHLRALTAEDSKRFFASVLPLLT